MTVSGTGDHSSESDTFYGDVCSFTTGATSTVTTGSASNVTSASATLSASYANIVTGNYAPQEAYIKYGTSSGNLNQTAYYNDGIGSASGSFSVNVASLSASTTYYYKAYMTVWNGSEYVTISGSQASFTTSAAQQQQVGGWLELPEVTGNEDFVGKFYGSGNSTGKNRNYSYSYNYTYYASMWVAYPLTAAHTSGSASTSSWRYNPDIANNKQVNIISNSYGTMYGNSNYARGHQCPNASRKSDDTMNLHTYYSTNQTPQLQNKFNGSIWGSLETAVRNLTSSTDTVYVATGPVYRKVGGSESITYLSGASENANPSSLPVPNYYWKAILKVRRNANGDITAASTIGFWFDHREYETSEKYYDSEHVVSVNQIEQWTGLNLFHNLPDNIEESAESNTSWSSFQSYSNISSVTGKNWGSF